MLACGITLPSSASLGLTDYHQQPDVNYLPRSSPQLISLERSMLSIYCAGEIDLFENLAGYSSHQVAGGILKLTSLACGTNSSTLKRQRARAHQTGETRSTETEAGLLCLRPVVYSSLTGCTSCVVQSFKSCSSFIPSHLWTT